MSESKPKASRQSFGEALAELGKEFPNIVVLDADLSKSTKSELFAKSFPDRFFEMGIAEQNMIGVAAGLGSSGHNAFCCSFACFVAGRFETIKMSVAYAKANVKIVGTHAGIGIGPDGYSQMGLEDLSMMRALPGMTVFQPADDIETRQMMRWLATYDGAAYLRLTRQELAPIHDATYKFTPGKLDIVVDHATPKIAIFGTGGTSQHAKAAVDTLNASGVAAMFVNVPSIKPFDTAETQVIARRCPLILTVEDHNVLGGLGGAVAEAVADLGIACRVVRHGLLDVPGESGEPEELYAKYKLDASGILSIAKSLL